MLNIFVSVENDKTLVTGHHIDNSISIHGTNFSLNLPLRIIEVLVADLQQHVLSLKRFNEVVGASKKEAKSTEKA